MNQPKKKSKSHTNITVLNASEIDDILTQVFTERQDITDLVVCYRKGERFYTGFKTDSVMQTVGMLEFLKLSMLQGD